MAQLSEEEKVTLELWSKGSFGTFILSTVGTIAAIADDNGPILVISAGLFVISMLCVWGLIQAANEMAEKYDKHFLKVLQEASDEEE